MQETPKAEYLPCLRGGYHFGELLNMVCLQKGCQEQLMCCCACVEENHKQHKTKPLRLLMLQVSQTSLKVKPNKFNIDIALELINSHLKTSIANFTKFKQTINDSLQVIENSIINYYSYLTDQVKLKNTDPVSEINQSFKVINLANAEPKDYVLAVRRIIGLTDVKNDEGQLREEDIVNSLNVSNEEMRKQLMNSLTQVTKKLQDYNLKLQETIKGTSIWKQSSFKFSPIFKHTDIKIVQDTLVKSTNSASYKFAIMEPHLETGASIKSFGFKIKESTSNWVAVGVCHKNIVASKNYGFNFSSIGHGAYMISANGGSWSHSKVEHNNSVKAFKFAKGDIVGVKFNMVDKTIVFKKGTETYSLTFETIVGNELYPCVLFYYLNDEVEFLANYQG